MMMMKEIIFLAKQKKLNNKTDKSNFWIQYLTKMNWHNKDIKKNMLNIKKLNNNEKINQTNIKGGDPK